jgi:Cu+-exporting ATPase
MDTHRITLAIDGLNCGGGGALEVERALARVAGVVRAYVNPLTERAYIDCDRVISPTDLQAAVRRAGYQAGIAVSRARTGNDSMPRR